MAMTVEERKRRLGVAQVEALFDFIPVAAVAAAVAAVLLATGLGSLGFVEPRKGNAWLCYLLACAMCNLVLQRLYRRWGPAGEDWRVWALAFTALNLAVGLGFGWAPIGLMVEGRVDAQLLVLLITLIAAAGAVTAFGPYLPAFLCFFLAATLPFAAASFFVPDPLLRRLGAVLMPVFICGVGGLGMRANRAFAQQVSLQMRTEEMALDLQRQRDIAERANLAKSSFLAAASHDLRQPLHALSLFVGALRGLAMPKEAYPLIDQIDASIGALDGLFGALLEISRLDAGAVAVRRQRFAIRSILARVCGDCAPEAEERGVRLAWVDCADIVNSDPVLIERIVRNLVSNAVRYTPRGRILVGCRRRKGAIVVQVWDTGVGIAPEEQSRIFQEYYQIGNPERDRAKGLGLGLAIVRRLADLLGCELTLRSQPGKGSCFAICVPLASVQSLPQPATAPPLYAFQNKLIVVVDDEAAIREGMSTLLANWGHRVIAAGSGDEAIARLSDCLLRPDLLICDYRLRGDENGAEVIERLRAKYNDALPAMLITGDTAQGRLAEAKARGVVVLHKPVSNAKLRAAIANLMAAGEPLSPEGSNARAPLVK